MNNSSISNRAQKFNELQRLIAELANEPEEEMIKFALGKGHTLEEIADFRHTTKQNLSKKYPGLATIVAKQRRASK